MEQTLAAKYFFGFLQQREVEFLLAEEPEGTFMIRFLENLAGFAINFRHAGRSKQLIFLGNEEGEYSFVPNPQNQLILGILEYSKFPSIQAIVSAARNVIKFPFSNPIAKEK